MPESKSFPTLHVVQLHWPSQFSWYQAGIEALLGLYADILLDQSCEACPQVLLQNLAGSLPHVWVVTDPADTSAEPPVYGLVSLTDEIPGRHAFIHGLSSPCIRRHPVITQAALSAMAYAFRVLRVQKIKAEFETNNRSATGFCRRMGFVKEAHFKNDNLVRGQWHDVAVHSLTAERFARLAERFQPISPLQSMKGNQSHVIRTQ